MITHYETKPSVFGDKMRRGRNHRATDARLSRRSGCGNVNVCKKEKRREIKGSLKHLWPAGTNQGEPQKDTKTQSGNVCDAPSTRVCMKTISVERA